MGAILALLGFPESEGHYTSPRKLEEITEQWENYTQGLVPVEDAIVALNEPSFGRRFQWFWAPVFNPSVHLYVLWKANAPEGRVSTICNCSGIWVPGVIIKVS